VLVKGPVRITLIAVGVILFLGISGLLARFLSVENVEREDDLALIQAESAGNVAGMLRQLSGCAQSPTCVATVRANAANPRLRRGAAVKILQLTSPTADSLTGATGRTRLAWTVIGKLPIVQCVLVKRSGNFLSGISVQLLALSAPIPNEGDCSPHPGNEDEEL
jgi:hypothetical protein